MSGRCCARCCFDNLYLSTHYIPPQLATVLLYLHAPDEGGETIFPLEGKDGLGRLDRGEVDYRHCDVGLKVRWQVVDKCVYLARVAAQYKPKTGDALLFYSMYPNGTFDRHSLHGGCPVGKGTKWVMTKWLRIESMMTDFGSN